MDSLVSGMLEDGGDGLHISDAYHKAFLEVSYFLLTLIAADWLNVRSPCRPLSKAVSF